MEHFLPQIQLGEDQKKRSSPKMEHFFSPNSSGHLRWDAHQSQIIGGDADVDHTQTIGWDTANLLGGIHPPLVSAPLYRDRSRLRDLQPCFEILPSKTVQWENTVFYYSWSAFR